MNVARRKDINELIAKLEEAHSLADQIATEERDYHDNMPESIQSGERGEQADAAATALEEAAEAIQEALDRLNDAVAS